MNIAKKFKLEDYARDISPENGGIFQITNEAQLEQVNLDSSYIAINKELNLYKNCLESIVGIVCRKDFVTIQSIENKKGFGTVIFYYSEGRAYTVRLANILDELQEWSKISIKAFMQKPRKDKQ